MSFLKNIFGKKEESVRSYEDFWSWFQKNEKVFFKVVKEKGNIEKDFFAKLSPKLNEIKEGFFYLTGMHDVNTVELVITADGAIKDIIFVEQLVNSAPAIAGWKFTSLKPALEIDNLNIEMAGYQFNKENIHFYANEFTEYPDEIDITILHDDLTEENRKTITTGIYIFLDNYIGELNFATTIDNIAIIGKSEAQKEPVPMSKLKDFLGWREKEFIEKYEGLRHGTENDNYSMLEVELENGNALLAVINTDLINWDSKASHPWILTVEIKYNGEDNNGMPDEETYGLLDQIEQEILEELKDFDGYLNIGRQTANSLREIYFACIDFRKPSKVLYNIEQKYSKKLDLTYDIYKDKYWQSFNRFVANW